MTTPDRTATGPAGDVVRRWYAARTRASARREAVLASDAERERVCELLNEAFGEGRLTSAELDERTSRALASRTHGDLADVLAGLADLGSPVPWQARREQGIVPRLVFWIVGLLTSPFVLLGSMLVLFGEDGGSKVFGLVLLVVFLPGLIALYRWAHPRT